MIENILNKIKKLIPKRLFNMLQPAYHFVLGYIAAAWYGHPSENMVVIGITGTTGKTTSVFLTASILKEAGLKVGYISTAMIGDGEKEWLNDKKMTMLGRFYTQRILKEMKKNNCDAVIIETTSQGIVQFRHRFINYDILLFTGLYPEHVEAHGGFENYKKAKGELFAHLRRCKIKSIKGRKITKATIINADDEHADYFSSFWAEKKVGFTACHPERSVAESKDLIKVDSSATLGMTNIIKAENIITNNNGVSFAVNNAEIKTNLLGEFNVANILAAICVAKSLDIPMEEIKTGLEKIQGVPGHLEKIANDKKITIIVDYAFEPNAVMKLYETIKNISHNKIIHVLGSCGGGRDKARRPQLGKLAGDEADFVIITNEDPYDEDPMEIINEVASGAGNKTENVNLWKILDRREAIKKALSLAQENDIVLVTGKGCEQAMCVADNKKIPWDDRKIVREELENLS